MKAMILWQTNSLLTYIPDGATHKNNCQELGLFEYIDIIDNFLFNRIILEYADNEFMFADGNTFVRRFYAYYVKARQDYIFEIDKYLQLKDTPIQDLVNNYNVSNSSDTPQIETTKDTIIDLFKQQTYNYTHNALFDNIVKYCQLNLREPSNKFIQAMQPLFANIFNQQALIRRDNNVN